MASTTPTTPTLSTEDLRNRLREHVYAMYQNYSFFIKGAIVALAGLAIIEILATPSSASNKIARIVLWIVSFSFSLVTIATWSRGAAFITSRANIFDIVLPVTIGMVEGILFLVLIPIYAPSTLWQYWYVVFGTFSSLAVGLVLNRLSQTYDSDYERTERLAGMLQEYRDWLKDNVKGAKITTLIGFGMFDLCQYDPGVSTWVHVAVGAVLTLIAFKIVHDSAKEYATLRVL